MRGREVQDLVQRGLGCAARVLGEACDVYRARGAGTPLVAEWKILQVQAAFLPPGAGTTRPVEYGQAVWDGVFDAAYTRPGDYLVRRSDRTVWFVAAQQELLPVMCVRAERVVGFVRPGAAAASGVNGYGGVTVSATPLFAGWPASVLAGGGGGMERAGLPGDTRPGSWHVLLPAVPGVVLRGGDLMTDDLGRSAVVASAELSGLGWRLVVRQSNT